jgi:hypothetical protein
LVGVAANANGNLVTEKKWANESADVYTSAENLTTSYVGGNTIDLADAASVSLLIRNDNNVGFTIKIYAPGTGYRLNDAYGSEYGIHVSAKRMTMITPDDLPILQWLPELKIAIALDEAISGTPSTFIVKAIIKR